MRSTDLRRSIFHGILAVLVITAATASLRLASAQVRTVRFDIPAGGLAQSLDLAARTANVSLIFDPSRLKGLHSRPIHLTGDPLEAFNALLAGTGLSATSVDSGNYIVVALPAAPAAELAVATVPEILVVGRRSQNADIERRANDIQPYRVLSSSAIDDAHADTVEQLLGSGLASNSLTALSSQEGFENGANVSSSINLRGLGTDETLVLVDGRRLPRLASEFDFSQSDLNGLPMAAIERVEVLSGTAGGLYGPGATGGVVNIVLKQQFPALWIQSQGGVDQRGDGGESRFEGGFSWNSPGGGTRLSVVGGYSQSDGLTFGDRNFVQAARAIRESPPFGSVPTGANVNVTSANGSPLILSSAYGGASLGSPMTNFPVNAGGAGGNLVALLKSGAGSFDTRLSNDVNGTQETLLTPDRTRSIDANLHQDFGSHVEFFANLLDLWDEGRATVPAIQALPLVLAPGQGGNPFQNTIIETTPYPGAVAGTAITESETLRVTAGLIARLGRGWGLEADASYATSSVLLTDPTELQVVEGDAFTPGTAMADAVANYDYFEPTHYTLKATMQDYSLRVAGPLATLPSGPATMTITTEFRTEATPGMAQAGPIQATPFAHSETVASIVDELRVPLVGTTSHLVLVRGLELQLAARADRDAVKTDDINVFGRPGPEYVQARHTTLAFTVGAKATPVQGVTLRLSYASGYLPPTADQIIPGGPGLSDGLDDPKRAGTPISSDARLTYGGTPQLQPELAQTYALGLILQPTFAPGLRASVDYTLIEKSHEITTFAEGDFAYFIQHESAFPGHVIRAPLTAADAALGYTGGVVTEIDATSLNSGRTTVQAVDVDIDYVRATPWGRIRLYGAATWEPSFRRKADPFGSSIEMVNLSDGPLAWKGNGGIEWSRDRLGATLNVQYFGRYNIADSDQDSGNGDTALRIAEQGSATVPAQIYVDLGFKYRVAAPGGGMITYQLAIKDLLDTFPPFVVPLQGLGSEGGYSFYGDPRGRRFIASVGLAF